MSDSAPHADDARPDQHLYRSLGALRDRCPVAEVRTARGRPAWLVLGAAQVRDGLRDRRLSVQGEHSPNRAVKRRAMDIGLTSYDGDMHGRLRAMTRLALNATTAQGYGPRMSELANELLDRLPRRGTVDLMSAFAHPFSFAAIAEVFGLAADVREPLYRAFLEIFDRTGQATERLDAAIDLLEGVIHRELAARRRRPRQDALGALLTAWRADGSLVEDELVSLAGTLMTAGFDTTAQSIGMSVVALLDRPALTRELSRLPERWPEVREELLRLDTPGPFSTPRQALADVELGGVVIPRGSQVIFAYAAANRDPEAFVLPDEMDTGRPRARGHFTFGLGPHTCPGAALARVELTQAVLALITAAPDLRLAVPRGSLVWSDNAKPRRLTALPVVLGPGPAAVGRG